MPENILPIARSRSERSFETTLGTAKGGVLGAMTGVIGMGVLGGAVAMGAVALAAPLFGITSVATGFYLLAGGAAAVASGYFGAGLGAAVGAVTGLVGGFASSRKQLDQERAAVNVARVQGMQAMAQAESAKALQMQAAVAMQDANVPTTRMAPAGGQAYIASVADRSTPLGAGMAATVSASRQAPALLEADGR